MLIRRARREDVNSLLEIEGESFDWSHFPLSRACFHYHLRRNLLFVCEEDGGVIGYILWLERKTHYRLYSLAVRKEKRGKGVAKKLLDYSFEVLNGFKEFRLEVRCDNREAINLYMRNGFEIKGILKSYYPDGADGYRMVREPSENLTMHLDNFYPDLGYSLPHNPHADSQLLGFPL